MSNIRHVVWLYTLFSLLLTWPLALDFTTHVPGDGIDDPSLAWNLWWVKTRLVDQLDFDIFHVGWMFHPIDINLAFYTLTPLNGLLSLPLQTSFSLIIANNLILLSSFVMGGIGAFLLTKEQIQRMRRPATAAGAAGAAGAADETDERSAPWNERLLLYASFMAGLIYAFSSSKLFYVSLGQFNIASSHWVPFCILYTLRIGQRSSLKEGWHNIFMAALFLIFQAWAELTYATFLIIFMGIYVCWQLLCQMRLWERLARQPQPSPVATRDNILLPYTALALLFLLGLAPFLWAMLPDMRLEGDFFSSGGGFADIFSADLMGYLMPTRLHPLLGSWTASLPFSNDKGQHIYVGYVAMGLALTGFLYMVWGRGGLGRKAQRSGWFWGFSTLFFWLLTLGPWVRWSGQSLPLPGPFTLISLLPFFNGNRYPSRYSIMLTLSVAVLAGVGCYVLLARFSRAARQGHAHAIHRRRLITWAVAGLFLLEHLSIPLPMSDFRVPSIYQKLAEEPGDFAVLELPTGWRNGARAMGYTDDVLLMMQQWYQTAHGKRRLGGNTSRNPAYKFQYFTEAPLVGDLIGLMNADAWYLAPYFERELPQMIERNRQTAPQVLNALGVSYVLVHMERATDELLDFVDNALPLKLVESWSGADWMGAPSTIRLYQVEENPALNSWQIQLAEPSGKLYLAEGWSALGAHNQRVRYGTRQRATLLLPIPPTGGQLKIELFGPASQAALYLNGQPLTTVEIDVADTVDSQIEGHWVEIDIPPEGAGGAVANQRVDRLVDRLEVRFIGSPASVPTLAGAPEREGWPIGETGAFLPPQSHLVVRSAGDGVGKFARIMLNGREVALDQRGYNLVALDAQGRVQESVVFDTCACDPGQVEPAAASMAMAQWLSSLAEGTIVAGAVSDEASVHLGQDAVDALAWVGVGDPVQGRFRWSHAFVGVVGAAPHSAVETLTLIQPATASVGLPIDAPWVSGGVGHIEFTAR